MRESLNSYSNLSDSNLAELSKNGDDNAFNELVVRYLSMINFIARRYSAEGYDQNDFVQEGLLGLLYSCRTFDKNATSSFKNYMSLVVERRFISIIRRFNTKKSVPKSAVIQMDDILENIEDVTQSPEELIMCREQLGQSLEKLKKVLSKTEYEVMMLFASGMSYREIARKLSITEKSADNALHRARRKICGVDMSCN